MALSLAERREMIAKLQELPSMVEAAVAGLGEEQLDAPGGEGEWSVRQVVHHLADAHMNAFARTKLVITEAKPILKPYDQEKWAELPDSTGVPIELSLSILRGLHRRWAVLLQGLPEEAWRRQGVHLQNGLQALEDMLAIYVRHGDAHLEQIAKIRRANGW
ncbi:MAG: YfiT family bacillithiol transferase [Sphingomonadaceae bacterium]